MLPYAILHSFYLFFFFFVIQKFIIYTPVAMDVTLLSKWGRRSSVEWCVNDTETRCSQPRDLFCSIPPLRCILFPLDLSQSGQGIPKFFFFVVGVELVLKHKKFQAVLCVSSKRDGNDSSQCPSAHGFWHCRGLAQWELLDFSLPDKHMINSGNAFITGKLRRSEILLYSSTYVLLEVWRWLRVTRGV